MAAGRGGSVVFPDVDSALRGIDGLAAIEHAPQLVAKNRVDEVVAPKHGAQQTSPHDLSRLACNWLIKRLETVGRG
jgi:hypothetical protein